MNTPPVKTARALFLARVALGLPLVRETARLLSFSIIAAACGFIVLLAALRFAPNSRLSPLPSVAGIGAAAFAGGALGILALRRMRRRQASEFARSARRLGEEKSALSELRSACRRLARALERAVPEVLAENDAGSSWSTTRLRSVVTGAFSRGNDQRLASRLLRIARAAEFFSGTDLELKKLALAGPCAEVIEQYRRLVGPDREVIYMEDGGGAWLAAPIDRPLFVLLMRELLDNVLDHAGDWNRITVTTEPVAGAVVLRVRDDGRGIPADALRGIFAGNPPGSRGLGLSLVRAIVEAHGGSLRIESEAGRGTRVSLKLPTHENARI